MSECAYEWIVPLDYPGARRRGLAGAVSISFERRVKPDGTSRSDGPRRESWWRFLQKSARRLYRAIAALPRVVVRVSYRQCLGFAFLPDG